MQKEKTGHGFKNGIHWAQTAAGKKKLSKALKKHARAKDREVPIHKAKEVADATGTRSAPEIDDATFAYALGYIESWLGTYSASAGVPSEALTARLGKVLHSKAGR